ncbi:MAG: YdaU family protein [Candidatus Puniceispirillaceae bacterium]
MSAKIKLKGNSMGLQWYPRYAGDYIRKTRHLSLLEHGAYTLLLDHYYATGKPIEVSNASLMPDHSRVHRLCSASTNEEKAAVDSVLEMFFELTDEGYINAKAAQVIEQQRAAHERRVNAGRKGGKQSSSNAPAKPKQPEPEPEPNNIYNKDFKNNGKRKGKYTAADAAADVLKES